MKNKYELINLKNDNITFKSYSPLKMSKFISCNISPIESDNYMVVISRKEYILHTIKPINFMIIIQDLINDLEHRKKL